MRKTIIFCLILAVFVAPELRSQETDKNLA
jgi:hypothetical protein